MIKKEDGNIYLYFEKNREATEAIKTVIANYSNSNGYSYFRSQVGAVIASLDSNITQTLNKSTVTHYKV